jgi:virginiamycin B lyase
MRCAPDELPRIIDGMRLGPPAATLLLLTGVLLGCAADERPEGPDSSSETPSETPTPEDEESPGPTYLEAGDLPPTLSLEEVGARTRPALPFADFAVAVGDGVWLSGVAPGAVRYSASGAITARTRIPGVVVQALAATPGSVWVPSLNPSVLFRLDATTGDVLDRTPLPASPAGEAALGAAGDRAYVLVEPSEPRIAVVEGSAVVEEIEAPEGAVAVRAGFGSLWVPTSAGTVERYDLGSGSWTSVPVGPSPRFLDVGFGAVWVMNQGDGSVSRIDPRSGESEQLAMAGQGIGGGDLTVGGGAVWLRTTSAVIRIDPRTRRATHVIGPPPGSASAAATDDFLLISNHDHNAVHVVQLPLPR